MFKKRNKRCGHRNQLLRTDVYVPNIGTIDQHEVAGLAGITAYIGYCLLDVASWKQLPQMPRLDAAAFIVTGISILFVNAAVAVALGCSLYVAKFLAGRAVQVDRVNDTGLQFE